ncbi:MAG: AAA family ATPase [Deltaproteobacteria bacterium]|nr:AAA family ATPase [Deltaproteobacteria bacterium]
MGRMGAFPQTSRFEPVRRIGAGSMGVVYEAYDRERDAVVALKALQLPPEGNIVLRFKNEFRGLQGLRHPNLIGLHELLEKDGQWFFTMELLEGVDFLEYVRPSSTPWNLPLAVEDTLPSQLARGSLAEPRGAQPLVHARQGDSLNLPRLRSALTQLAFGLNALHRAQKVHRDIKPSNVLVTREGRVVLLDFGLSAEFGAGRHSELLGTPRYMAPEQAAQRAIGPEADWYAVGVVLYEALTGRLPFDGSLLDVLEQKLHREPPPPHALTTDVPEDLDKLCVELLRLDPRARPAETEILRRLGADASHVFERATATIRQSTFVGRAEELAKLHHAYDDARQGGGVTVFVRGPSGVGKSELVRKFSETVAPFSVVLAGRCFERESVPYKACDGVIDALSDYLSRLPNDQVARLMPHSASRLLHAFPVLRRVEHLVKAPVAVEKLEPHQQRARVFEILRELLCRLAEHSPLVLVIDDLQWADQDSLALLSEVTRSPNPPAMLLVATVRDTSDGNAVSELNARIHQIPSARELMVGMLPEEHARELAAEVVRRAAPTGFLDEAAIAAIAAEAGGHPLFIDELVRHAVRGTPGLAARLDDAILARVNRLGEESRRIVELLAMSGRPIQQTTAAQAACMEIGPFMDAVEELRDENLARTDGTRRSDSVEPYHDRVRESVLATLAADRKRSLHERLALALESSGNADPEALSILWGGAGDQARAARFALAAAEQAAKSLAFERAVRLFRQAIDMGTDSHVAWEHYGDALANAGLGAGSAEAYEQAAKLASATEASRLRHQAAELLLRTGHIDRGIEVLAPILDAHGLTMPKTSGRAVFSFLAGRALLKLRRPKLGFRERPCGSMPAKDVARMELCWSAFLGLFTADQIRGLDYHVRYLRMALAAGDPLAIAKGFATEAACLAAVGAPRSQSGALLERSGALAARLSQPYADGWLGWARGAVAYLSGSWGAAYQHGLEAERILRERCIGVRWEIDCVQQLSRWALCYLGRLEELGRIVRDALAEAKRRGDLYASMSARSGFPNIIWLVDDDVETARRETTEGIAQWSQEGFHLQHLFDLFAQVQIDLYAGDQTAAFERLEAHWPSVERSGLLQLQLNRVLMLDLRARVALGKSRVAPPSEATSLLRQASMAARRIRRDKCSWGDALAQLIDAQVALAMDRERASTLLEDAATKLENAEMALHAAAARAAQGDDPQAVEHARLERLGVKRPDRFLSIFAPGA